MCKIKYSQKINSKWLIKKIAKGLTFKEKKDFLTYFKLRKFKIINNFCEYPEGDKIINEFSEFFLESLKINYMLKKIIELKFKYYFRKQKKVSRIQENSCKKILFEVQNEN